MKIEDYETADLQKNLSPSYYSHIIFSTTTPLLPIIHLSDSLEVFMLLGNVWR